MTIKYFFLIVAGSILLTFSMALTMYDSVEGLGFEQTDAGLRGGVRG